MNDQTQKTSTWDSTDLDALRRKVAELHPTPKLFVIRKPKNDPFGFYRENAGGYTSSVTDAWKVTEEQGRKYTLYADAKPGTDAYCERVVLEPSPIPNYLRDLNACAEFEKGLTEEQRYDYIALVLGKSWGDVWTSEDAFNLLHATAKQRCRAFVAVMEGRE